MSKFNVGDRVRVLHTAPLLQGQYGVVTDDSTNIADVAVLVDGDEGTGTAMYDHELELVVVKEEHQLVSREELEERFVLQRNTIQSLQEKVAEYEQVIQYTEDQLDDVLVQLNDIRDAYLQEKRDEEDARRNRTHFMVFKGLPRGGKFKSLPDAEELAGNLADRDHGNYSVVTVEDFEDGKPPILVAEYVGVRTNILEAVQYNDEED